jgi:geranylgeranyl pyrophosphate synthase
VYSAAEIFDDTCEKFDPIALAIELVHCYSLIHDDLPAMDNDDLRRGKPTCHLAFDEATAILAGDALLTMAFEILADPEVVLQYGESNTLKIIQIISQAAGAKGMVQGQSVDLSAQGKTLNLQELTQMHLAKTGALIAASVQCGALATGKASLDDLDELLKFGQAIGLCFQIQDDILDACGHSEMMGKLPGQDVKNNKCTFVTLLGLTQAKEHAHYWHQQALTRLNRFGNKAHLLEALATYIIRRSN